MARKFSPVAHIPDELAGQTDWYWLFEQVLMQYLEVNFEETQRRFLDQSPIWEARYEEWLFSIFIPYWRQVCGTFQDAVFRSLIYHTLERYLIVRNVKNRLLSSMSERPSS